MIFVGDVTFLSLGQVEEPWDEVAIAATRIVYAVGDVDIAGVERGGRDRAAGLAANSTSRPSATVR